MEKRIFKTIKLSDGSEVKMEVIELGGREKVGFASSFEFSEVTKTISKLATDFKNLLDMSSAQKTTIEFAIEVGVESGGISAFFVKGTGSANFKITLEWEKSNVK